jgi:hypothetical protein
VSTLKIGVLTFHRCINYGSYWQARCLAEALIARGHDVVILDHHSPRINLAEWKCALRPDREVASTKRDAAAHRRKMRRFFRAFDALPLSSRFPIESPGEMDPCDVVVVGSDEVWNLFHPWYGRCGLFYGDGVRTDRLVAYAASFGNYDADCGLEHDWAVKLRNFDLISVRDDNSRSIVEQAAGFAPEVVLDPCLQFPAGIGAPRLEPRTPYVALYGHGFSDAFATRVRDWATHSALPIVSIGYRNPWADEQWIAAGPHEFAGAIGSAEAVATNFFHGCVFALCNTRPFVCEASWYRGNKIRGLMAAIGGERHLLPQDASPLACGALLREPPGAGVFERIARLRERSWDYLDLALEPQVRYA